MDAILVGLILLAASGILWRLKIGKTKKCGGGCGCAAQAVGSTQPAPRFRRG